MPFLLLFISPYLSLIERIGKIKITFFRVTIYMYGEKSDSYYPVLAKVALVEMPLTFGRFDSSGIGRKASL
jgi:hypothetical protein